jgi:hypothetical protein
MKTRSCLTIGLLAVLLLVGCAPAPSPALAQPVAPVTEPPVESSPLPTETLPPMAATEVPATQMPTETPQVIATSRGPHLEATDPSTYTRASGGLQLVEFFAFW